MKMNIKPKRRHDADSSLEQANDLNSLWATFLRTGPGRFIKEHTALVRNIATGGAPARVALLILTLVVPGIVLLLSLIVHSLVLAIVALLIWMFLALCAIVFYSSYKDSEQQDADRLDTTPNLLSRRGVIQRLSGHALSLSADYALPGIRERLDSSPQTHGQRISPRLMGVLLGQSHDVPVWLSAERPVYVLAPARGGKTTSVVIPAIMEAPGAVVATSSRKDILDATFNGRLYGFRTGRRMDSDGASPVHEAAPAYVFDPLGITATIDHYASHRIYWNPVATCRDPKQARSLATALIGAAHFSDEDSTWAHIGVDITQALLLAAALTEKGLDTVYQWSQSMTGINHAQQILASEGASLPVAQDWRQALERLSADDQRTVANKLLTMSSAFSALSLPEVRAWFTPHPEQPQFDMTRFLRSKATVYMLSELRPVNGQADASAAVFNCMFLNWLRDTARHIATQSEGGKLEPSVTLVLDEVANISPWPELPQLFTAGSGDGIWPIAVFQSREQAKDAFNRAEPQMWESGQKVILGGLSEMQTLRDISVLTGEYREKHHDQSYRNGVFGVVNHPLNDMSTMERSDVRPSLRPDDVRRIPRSRALLISYSVQAAAVTLTPYWQRGWHTAEEGALL